MNRQRYLGTSNLNVSMLDCVWILFFLSLITKLLFMIKYLMLFCVFSLWLCLVVKFTLLFNIYLFQKFDPFLFNGSKVQKFGALFEAAPILVPPSFGKFCLFFILAYTENFMCLASLVKKIEFRWLHFGENHNFDPPNFGQVFFIYLFTLNTSCFQLEKLKTLNFRWPCLEGLLSFEPPIFVRLSLFLISTDSDNSIHLPLMV